MFFTWPTIAQVAERSNAADCKSADFGLRRFESSPVHIKIKSQTQGLALYLVLAKKARMRITMLKE